MVKIMAEREGLLAVDAADGVALEKLLAEAKKWEIRHGGVSGRTARQFINYMLGQKE